MSFYVMFITFYPWFTSILPASISFPRVTPRANAEGVGWAHVIWRAAVTAVVASQKPKADAWASDVR